ncbi:hypothetical protein [Catalinimonas niigatensis]|uniref:hypothetical protein n=1 Tax=Catalinimonas niigatensis TaxID=1397264 RepID=UPI00266508B0|nr:hypothetical protein [Catalinimonas niigatensis]WPP49814.1 hypothetical protein PZB72_24385 [Catalinimonas niigatensis]
MKSKNIYLSLLLFFLILSHAQAQSSWPKEIQLNQGEKVIIYQPQPESLEGNLLKARAAISIRQAPDNEPIFGAIWAEARLLTDRDYRIATLENITITNIRFPDIGEESQINELKNSLELQVPQWNLDIALDDLLATLETAAIPSAAEFNNQPPKIIYVTTPTMLVLIDGEPLQRYDEELNIDRIINTPFLIVMNPDDQIYYLYGDKFWYQSAMVTKGWKTVKKLPKRIKKLKKKIEKQQGNTPISQYVFYENPLPPEILVSTVPAELIQSEGEPQFASIEGTSLLYMSNTDNDIFMDIDSQQYYIVLSGRWYTSRSLYGAWQYHPSDQLPEDFASIPEGSEKDGVLVYVAHTEAAEEAVLDAQIPQTARVDRHSAQCSVTYDGNPQFEPIEGTNLDLAMNTSSTILRANKQYFCVENGVWFVSAHATGPWVVSAERPADIDRILPGSAAYHVRYVYIYDVTPDFIYMGYMPGYLGWYVFGPTVVYGTGYYYRPWYGRFYYPRPLTWGFGMLYDPWTGWSMSVGFNVGWYYWERPYRYYGWWGPPMYRPAYHPSYRASRAHQRSFPVPRRNSYSNNLYRYRRDAYTRDINRRSDRVYVQSSRGRSQQTTTPPQNSGRQPASTASQRTRQALPSRDMSNNVYTDRQGNIYRRDQSGQWQKRETRTWKAVPGESNNSIQQVQRQKEMRDRGQVRTNTFNQTTRKTTTSKKNSNRGRSNQ